MNTKLITALRTSARAIEDGTIDYDWQYPDSCNCGVLACALIGSSPHSLKIPETDRGLSWKEIVGQHCPITGMPEHETLRAFYNAGLVQKDIIELENLSNPDVLARCDFGNDPDVIIPESKTWLGKIKPKRVIKGSIAAAKHRQAQHVVIYMRAWADLLQERGALDVAVSKPEQQPA